MLTEEVERLIVKAYRAGMKNGIREYAVWKDGQQLVGVMRRPLCAVLAEVDAVPERDVLRAAVSQIEREP